MDDKIYDLLLKLPKKNLINLMWDALDEMQAYNGRSRQYCILSVIGAEEVNDGKWRIPKITAIKRNTDSMGL